MEKLTERQQSYSPGNMALLRALKATGGNYERAWNLFAQEAMHDQTIITECVLYYAQSQMQFVKDEMDEVTEAA